MERKVWCPHKVTHYTLFCNHFISSFDTYEYLMVCEWEVWPIAGTLPVSISACRYTRGRHLSESTSGGSLGPGWDDDNNNSSSRNRNQVEMDQKSVASFPFHVTIMIRSTSECMSSNVPHYSTVYYNALWRATHVGEVTQLLRPTPPVACGPKTYPPIRPFRVWKLGWGGGSACTCWW